ncbi:MAG TPA: tetratricopeptide repeat protein [Kofleriaceae bacterium]
MRNIIILTSLLAAAACGGATKGATIGTGKAPPPPPSIGATNDIAEPGKPAAAKVEVSADAKKDYQAAVESFRNQDKGGSWSESACRSSAERFQAVVRSHSDLIAAQFMVGLSYQRCNMNAEAESAYQQASRMKGDATKAAMALSNLGQLYYKTGKVDAARQYWDSAVKANGKLIAARINLASMNLEQMRKIKNPKDGSWKKLEEEARFNLSNALGVDTDSVEAYTVFGLIYMEGAQVNKNRLDLAKTLMDEANKRNPKYPPLLNAYGLYWMKKNSLNQALQAFQGAVEGDPKFVEARVNAGLLTLGFRKYDAAKEFFAKAVELAPKNYDATIGLGVALRGLNDLDGAEAQYKKAQGIDGSRGDAYFNLGVLYKDFRANKQNDPDQVAAIRKSVQVYRQAKEFFNQFLSKSGSDADKAEAKENIKDCDKVVKQLEQFADALAKMPKQPVEPPKPTPAPAPAGGTPPAGGATPTKK